MSRIEQSAIFIQPMTGDHIEAAVQLCREAGWNQLNADWRRLTAYEPNGCFVAVSQGQLVGTVTTTRYGSELAWIGMMLVHPQHRRRGIATALVRHSIDYLQAHRVRCIKLDATPAGEFVYRKLGFEVEWSFHRWRRDPCNVESPIETDFFSPMTNHVLELDRRAFGTDRSQYLDLLCNDSRVSVTEHGFGMLRQGSLASYIGPLSARTASAAASIVARLCASSADSIFWDIPTPNPAATDLARTIGFAPVRDLTRMKLGGATSHPDLKLQFAIADPGTG